MAATESSSNTVRKTRTTVPVKEKMGAVLRVLGGESLETVAENLSVSPRRLSEWQEKFLEGGEANLIATSTKPKSTNQLPKALGKSIGQWAGVLVALFVVVYVLVRMLDRSPAQ